jgi:hypothetical protein
MNRTQFISPTSARWYDNQLITEVPHRLLNHARRLLDDEAVRQTPFSVGNTNLHYVVTRPQAGEYVIGIFNDKLTSEPFNITSAIGPITNQLEVALDDNKAELQSAAGGAAYAPPGLRTSPSLPLNYGLSDATHIEGRDFQAVPPSRGREWRLANPGYSISQSPGRTSPGRGRDWKTSARISKVCRHSSSGSMA